MLVVSTDFVGEWIPEGYHQAGIGIPHVGVHISFVR